MGYRLSPNLASSPAPPPPPGGYGRGGGQQYGAAPKVYSYSTPENNAVSDLMARADTFAQQFLPSSPNTNAERNSYEDSREGPTSHGPEEYLFAEDDFNEGGDGEYYSMDGQGGTFMSRRDQEQYAPYGGDEGSQVGLLGNGGASSSGVKKPYF
eukprot:1178735-Prorocentrum_minimum.AAC.1